MRQKNRETTAAKLKQNYKLNDSEPCVVHFDGKILPDISGKNKVDRLPVIVSNKNGNQLLGVPRIQNGTGKEICSAVFDIISDWGLLNNVQAISCDTTASNTGRIGGAWTLLQQRIGRNLMLLPCRCRWPQCDTFQHGLQVVQKITVINDISERKVKLIEEFNQILTNDEDQKQFLLLTVEQYRKDFPKHTKTALLSKNN